MLYKTCYTHVKPGYRRRPKRKVTQAQRQRERESRRVERHFGTTYGTLRYNRYAVYDDLQERYVMPEDPAHRENLLAKIAKAVRRYPKRVAIGSLLVSAGLLKAGTMIFSSMDSCGPICQAAQKASDWMLEQITDLTQEAAGIHDPGSVI